MTEFDIISYANDLQTLKQEANNQLRVQEAWVVWEPLTALNTDTTNTYLRKTFKHCFLVFKLDSPGQILHKRGFQFLRVERQYAAASESDYGSSDGKEQGVMMASVASFKSTPSSVSSCSAYTDHRPQEQVADPADTTGTTLLNIRFARTGKWAKFADVPSYSNDSQVPKNGAWNPCSDVKLKFTIQFDDHFTLGALWEVLQEVHDSRPRYNLTQANCVWFAQAVIQKCRNKEYISDPGSIEAMEAFSDYWATTFSTILQKDGNKIKQGWNLTKSMAKGLYHQGRKYL
eukprot:gene2807-3100_t